MPSSADLSTGEDLPRNNIPLLSLLNLQVSIPLTNTCLHLLLFLLLHLLLHLLLVLLVLLLLLLSPLALLSLLFQVLNQLRCIFTEIYLLFLQDSSTGRFPCLVVP